MFGYLLYVQVMVYLPVLIYAITVAIIACKMHYYSKMAGILLFTSILILLTGYIYLHTLQRRPLIKAAIPLPRVVNYLPVPLFSLPLYFLAYKRRQMLLVTKLFSLLLLYAFIQLYEPDHYDIRPLLLCFMLVTTANSAIVFEIKAFEDEYLSFTKNFSFTLVKRFCMLLATSLLLMLPELLFVWKGWPLHFHTVDYLQLLLLAIGLLSIFYGILLVEDMNTEFYFKTVFAVLTLFFFIILYNPGLALEIVLLPISYGLFASNYYNFEKKYK